MVSRQTLKKYIKPNILAEYIYMISLLLLFLFLFSILSHMLVQWQSLLVLPEFWLENNIAVATTTPHNTEILESWPVPVPVLQYQYQYQNSKFSMVRLWQPTGFMGKSCPCQPRRKFFYLRLIRHLTKLDKIITSFIRLNTHHEKVFKDSNNSTKRRTPANLSKEHPSAWWKHFLWILS